MGYIFFRKREDSKDNIFSFQIHIVSIDKPCPFSKRIFG